MTQLIQLTDSQELAQIEPSKALQIKQTFEPMVEMLQGFEDRYSQVMKQAQKGITEELTRDAKRLRLDISKVRISTEKTRKEIKEEYLRAGKAIDGVSNIVKWAITDRENSLQQIEDHFILLEKERLEKLQQERAEQLSEYVEDAHERQLAEMEEDVWSAYLQAKKKEYEDRIEAERQAEKERIERQRKEEIRQVRSNAFWSLQMFHEGEQPDLGEISEEEFKQIITKAKQKKAEHEAEQERIKKENIELQRKAEEEEKKRQAEVKRMQAERQAEMDRIEAERAKERAEKAKLEAELEARRKAEEAKRIEEEKAKESELSKKDGDKVKDLIADLEALKTKYSFSSQKNKKMYSEVGMLLDKVIGHVGK